MSPIDYKVYTFEALKITIFCLVVTGVFAIFGSSNRTLLVVFNMAVMSSAATFSVEQKHLNHATLGGLIIILSCLIGGVTGFYYPFLAKLLTIFYAGLAFYLPQNKCQTTIFVTGSVMFLIFSSLSFNFDNGVRYLLDGLIVFAIFILFYLLFDHRNHTEKKESININELKSNHITAIIAVLSLTLAASISYYLSIHNYFSHLYWIGLTALVVIQSSQQKTIHASIKRILVNAFGAIISVLLFNYVMPSNFLANFVLLVLFLFLIFFLGVNGCTKARKYGACYKEIAASRRNG
jgi:hypothetical protein